MNYIPNDLRNIILSFLSPLITNRDMCLVGVILIGSRVPHWPQFPQCKILSCQEYSQQLKKLYRVTNGFVPCNNSVTIPRNLKQIKQKFLVNEVVNGIQEMPDCYHNELSDQLWDYYRRNSINWCVRHSFAVLHPEVANLVLGHNIAEIESFIYYNRVSAGFSKFVDVRGARSL